MSKKQETSTVPASASWQDETFRIWRPKPGDELIGVYRETVEVPEGVNGPFKAHHIENETTFELMAVSGAVLDKAFSKIAPGTVVRVIYEGEDDLENGRRLNFYRVQTRRN